MALKTGAENKRQVAIAAALGLLVLVLVVWNIIPMLRGSSSTPQTQNAPDAPAQPPARVVNTSGNTSAGSTGAATKVAHSGANLDPTLHFELMQQAESLEYTGTGRNIFSPASAPLPIIPKVTRPVRPLPEIASGPPPPPPPPAIDLKFFGYSAQNSGRRAFLLHGDDVFIASEGDVVDHRYRVVKISPFSVQMEDLPYHDTQTISLTAN
ncbi:MAG TPA: hypothetical protein VGD59_04740 [Acidisarcina sp.]